MLCFFFFEQKAAYDLSISYWSSDVCSSDLRLVRADQHGPGLQEDARGGVGAAVGCGHGIRLQDRDRAQVKPAGGPLPRKSTRRISRSGHQLEPGAGLVHSRPSIEVLARSEERRVGKEWVSTGRSRWSPEQ